MADEVVKPTEAVVDTPQDNPVVDVEKIVEEKLNAVKAEYEKKLNDVLMEKEDFANKLKAKELEAMTEAERVSFLEKERQELIAKQIAEKDEKIKQYEAKEREVAFKESKQKLKEDNPLLIDEINNINTYEELNAFMNIKNVLNKKLSEYAKLKELDAKAGKNAMGEIGANSVDNKQANLDAVKAMVEAEKQKTLDRQKGIKI